MINFEFPDGEAAILRARHTRSPRASGRLKKRARASNRYRLCKRQLRPVEVDADKLLAYYALAHRLYKENLSLKQSQPDKQLCS